MDIDGKGLIMGRLATVAAKAALNGETVNVYNCGDMVITGEKRRVLNDFKRKRQMGIPSKGPFIQRAPSQIVKRAIRGMIPYKKSHGSEAFKRIKCYNNSPNVEVKMITIEKAHYSKIPRLKFITIREISKELGAKI